MGWLGKVVGGAIGFALGGPVGAVAGAVFGHAFDKDASEMDKQERRRLSGNEEAQMTFFVAAFSMLAKLSKADGRICENEVASIDQFMSRDLHLNRESRNIAINIFREAANSPEPFEGFARQFYNTFKTQPRMLEVMLDVMLRVSTADGQFSRQEEELILSAVQIFEYPTESYLKLKARYVDQSDKYHAVLGCDRSDSDEFVKKQYRKLVNEYHPDKIASKGLPEEFTHFAEEKFREIQEAWENVRKERGI
ncbi:MAG: co-chaperone DjlA [Desulfobacterales bacterium]|nr:co-chaperone DjlA [Desulfobacterales bacterium]